MELKIINKKSIKIAILLFPFFTFAFGLRWQLVGMAVNIMRLFCMVILGLWLISHKSGLNRLLNNKIFDQILLMFLVIAISSFINNKSVLNAVNLLLFAVIPFAVFNMFSTTLNGKKHILEGTVLLFEILIIINFLFMIIFSEGIYQTYSAGTTSKYYIFGAKNQMVAPVITGTIFLIEYSYNIYNKLSLNTLLLCVIHFVELAWGGSGTGLLMFALVLFFAALKNKFKNKMKLGYGLSFVFLIAIGIVLFRVQNNFAFFIEGIMHKSLTLSNRTFIWDAAISIVKSKLFLGYGVGESLFGDVYLDMGYMNEITFSHDIFLDYLVMGGIASLALFIKILFDTQNIYRKTEITSSYGKSFIWIGILVYMFASIVEIYTGNYCLFIMIAYIASLKVNSN